MKTRDPNIAYQLLRHEIDRDTRPQFNLATFVSTYMEPEVTRLITESLPKNFVDSKAYPVSSQIEARCLRILADMYHAPREGNVDPVGVSTVGSSEAIMLAVLALKTKWAIRQDTSQINHRRPNLIISSAAQVCWKKAARYFEVDLQYVPCSNDRFVLDPLQAVNLTNDDTIGTTYTGEYEDVKAVNDLLVERDLKIPIHVDAASGGFVAPFISPELEWDFRLERVSSINVSGHKYGFVYAGIGWALWRSKDELPNDLIFHLSYLGAAQASFTLNFSKSSSHVIAQYYLFIRLGRMGYYNILRQIIAVASHLTRSLHNIGFLVLSKADGVHGIPVVAFRLNPKYRIGFDEFGLANMLDKRGWHVPAYNMAEGAANITLLRVVCRMDFTLTHCEHFIADVKSILLEET
ncbi:glutamate decarboxylase [Penicillium taxi]|uniref:glutamate decarboxylase n=1 Tax=Penicillium taxi TaxID=168475 RepID=UPI002545325E|nr:glutamate decarboxylase [Penicillium taxi]KAJ5901793.1 glutamate decarboxylase [Penicillium taxi]